MYGELFITTQYDGHDYRSVLEIFHYDEDGDEQVLDDLTGYCQSITTCADQGTDGWRWIRDQVALTLDKADIKYESIQFSEDEPDL